MEFNSREGSNLHTKSTREPDRHVHEVVPTQAAPARPLRKWSLPAFESTSNVEKRAGYEAIVHGKDATTRECIKS